MEYTPKQAAEALNVSRATILRRIKAGSLIARKYSRTMIRIDADEIKAYKERCLTGNADQSA